MGSLQTASSSVLMKVDLPLVKRVDHCRPGSALLESTARKVFRGLEVGSVHLATFTADT